MLIAESRLTAVWSGFINEVGMGAMAASTTTNTSTGLEDIIVAETDLSDVDGERGQLIVRGYFIEDLVGRVTFEDACVLLWTGQLPKDTEREKWRARIGQARREAFDLLPALGNALSMPDGMDALRAALGHVRATGNDEQDTVFLAGAAAVFAAAWGRLLTSQHPIEPDTSQSQAGDYFRMLTGTTAAPPLLNGLDSYLCCVIDHGLNASTLAARVVASTGSDMVSAVVAGVGALKGPLHGGAPGPVLDMLDAIETPTRARPWLTAHIAAGHRIMGMGHRIYRVRDPRAAALERAATALERSGLGGARLALARVVECEAEALLAERHPERRLRANVEFYTAVLLEAIGIPRTLFSPTFAVSRVAGWCAHYQEQRRRGRLMRPLSRYIGPMPGANEAQGLSAAV
jgi:citrate synthase